VPDLRLHVGGIMYGGWKSVRVTRSLECIAGSFDLSVSDRWGGQQTPWPIAEEDECSIVIDGTPVITGYVDRRSLSYGAEEHQLSVGGRDRTGALVDCSAVLSKWEFLNVSVLALAQHLAKPFGIPVRLQPGLAPQKPIVKLTVDPGDTAFDALERACRIAGVLPVSDGLGGLVLTRAGSARATTALVEGQNILGASVDYDASRRFRRYVVMGQHQGSDDWSGAGAAGVKGEAQDANVRRGARVCLVRPEGAVTPEHARRRAEWEAKVRAARADAVTVTVQGWKQADGSLWPLNALVPLRSPMLGIDGELLIAQVTNGIDDGGGTVTTLSLARPDAFIPEPVISTASTQRWKEISGGVAPLPAGAELAKAH
jgi:prophage tail gpP-like protein